jgi:hypothetical protein
MPLTFLLAALAASPDLIGTPNELIATPAVVTLNGPREASQLLVSGAYANGQFRDLTQAVTVTANPPGIVSWDEGLYVRGLREGTTTLTLAAGGKSATVRVTVSNFASTKPPSFRNDVIATLNVGGCNMGACHGTPSGKNGFKLSLRGFDPAADFLQLTRDQFGRRTDSQNPAESLTLVKALGQVPHEGGIRFAPSSVPGEMLRQWISSGMPDDAANHPAVAKLDILPGSRVLTAPAMKQQLAVVAKYADGVARDVTRLTNFSSSDPAIADVTMNGLVEFKRPGEVAILCRYLEELVSVRLTYLEPRAGFVWPEIKPNNYVDDHVFAKLKTMTIRPSELCTDQEFVRRAFLDCIGRLPTVAETKSFLADGDAKKRDTLVQRLVAMPEFADFWAMKWSDVLRSSRKTTQYKGSLGVQKWLRDQFADNVPFDRTVVELLTASGNTFENPPANYYRIAKDANSLAESTAQVFLGVRMQCAKCHNHPFERWTQDDYYGMAAWFARVKQKPAEGKANVPNTAEVVFVSRAGDVTQPRTGRTMPPRYPGIGDATVAGEVDRRPALAAWLTSLGNPFFAKSVANRVWFHLMGRGIVDPVDDFRESNPASNDELLNALADDFAKSKFDFRKLVVTIMTSRTYQLSAATNETNANDVKYFSHAGTKLLSAEQLLDALCDVTGVPEKYAGLPAGTRAVQLPDGEVNHPFLKAFGQPARELPCECERESDGNLGQALQLINGPTVNAKLIAPNRLTKLLEAKKTDDEMLNELYFTALSRPPSEEDRKIAFAHLAKSKDKRKGWEDVLWAILNTREFLFRH